MTLSVFMALLWLFMVFLIFPKGNFANLFPGVVFSCWESTGAALGQYGGHMGLYAGYMGAIMGVICRHTLLEVE